MREARGNEGEPVDVFDALFHALMVSLLQISLGLTCQNCCFVLFFCADESPFDNILMLESFPERGKNKANGSVFAFSEKSY